MANCSAGKRRDELTLLDYYQADRQRFDMEHMLRFSKQRLLMGSFQTQEVEHEENWVQLTLLAYIQLWAPRDVASVLPRPWEKYHHKKTNYSVTPSVVQQDFFRIIHKIGTPAISPKPVVFQVGGWQVVYKKKEHDIQW